MGLSVYTYPTSSRAGAWSAQLPGSDTATCEPHRTIESTDSGFSASTAMSTVPSGAVLAAGIGRRSIEAATSQPGCDAPVVRSATNASICPGAVLLTMPMSVTTTIVYARSGGLTASTTYTPGPVVSMGTRRDS